MRPALLALPFLLLPTLALAQDPGTALNLGRGLSNGMSLGWTFRENWTLQPTIGASYSDQTGFEALVGSTVLRSVSLGPRVYAYAGAGVYYESLNGRAGIQNFGTPGQTGGGNVRTDQMNNSFAQNTGSLVYFTAPLGLRARLYGNFEAFAGA